MKIELEISEDNEGTAYPWWIIIDPRQNMRACVHGVANQIVGPFFSREEAQRFLDAKNYNFSKRACVYCCSGYDSLTYKWAIDKAEKEILGKVTQ